MRAFKNILLALVIAGGVTWLFSGQSQQQATRDSVPVQVQSDRPSSQGDLETLRRAQKQIGTALKDPSKVKLMECMGVKVYNDPQPPGHPPSSAECEKILQQPDNSLGTASQPRMTAPPLNINGSPALREYVALMLPVQRNLLLAYYAGLCGVRSDAYLEVFKIAQFKISQQEEHRLALAGAELDRAYSEINRIIEKERAAAGEFDVIKGCEAIRKNRAKLDELDTIHRELTGNYH